MQLALVVHVQERVDEVEKLGVALLVRCCVAVGLHVEVELALMERVRVGLWVAVCVCVRDTLGLWVRVPVILTERVQDKDLVAVRVNVCVRVTLVVVLGL